MASITIANANAYDVQVPLIGSSGSTVKVPANDSVTVSGDAIIWYTTEEVSEFYTKQAEQISGITVQTDSTTATGTIAVTVVDGSGSPISGATITATAAGGSEYSTFVPGTVYNVGDVIGIKVTNTTITATLSVTVVAGENNVVVCLASNA